MKKLTIILLALVWAGTVAAQDKTYFPATKGAELTYKYYNARGKALKDEYKKERWMKFTVEEVWPEQDGMVINVAIGNETLDRLAADEGFKATVDNLSYGDVKIADGMVTTDNMQWIVSSIPEFFSYIKGEDMKYRLELAALSSFPQEMAVGDTLPGENIMEAKWYEMLTEEEKQEREESMKEFRMEFQAMGGHFYGSGADFSSDRPIFTVTATTRNRKAEAVETVVTPAGTFECYKITYEVVRPDNGGFGSISVVFHGDMMMGGPHMRQQEDPSDKYADWVSPEVGLVKREKYNQRGKVTERMILETYKK